MNKVTHLPDGTEVADFEFGFTLDSKSVATNEENGDLFIEGYASDFEVDRQDEAFEPGAFEAGLKSYMATNPIMLYHHKADTAMGQIVTATLDSKGLYVKGRLDKPEPHTTAADVFNKVKAGTIRAFSVGGKFYRRMTAAGPRIFKCDLREISITPLGVNQRTLFAIAGKAFDSEETMEPTIDLEAIGQQLTRISALFDTAEEEQAWQKLTAGRKAVTTQDILDFEKVLEGKADGQTQKPSRIPGQGHPDAGKVALLLMHQQKIHQLAENTKQNAADPEVAKVAEEAQKSAKKHSSKLHQIAARIGPLPDYYGSLA